MRIAAAGPGDVEEVLRLEQECATAPHWPVASYLQVLEDEGSCLLAAWMEEKLVGFAVGRVIKGVGELESVAVQVLKQRGGVGRALCLAVDAWAREQGATEMGLEVRVGSAGARALYVGLGFVEVGRRVRYYMDPVEDAVLMTLKLNGPCCGEG